MNAVNRGKRICGPGSLCVLALAAGLVGRADPPDAARRPLPPELAAAAGTEFDKTTGLPHTVVHRKTGIVMVLIPPGSFLMGSPDDEPDRFHDEGPVHRVRISRAFYLSKCEVTNAEFAKAGTPHSSGTFEGRSLGGPNQPALYITSEKAKAFCAWAGLQLPTEAQWEYACRAGTTSRFWWGDAEADAGRCANVADRQADLHWESRLKPFGTVSRFFDADDGHVVSAPVGSFAPNPFGLHDMIGNAWEWCADRFRPDYYEQSPAIDPKGPEQGARHTIRGGSWWSPPCNARAAVRYGIMPGVDYGSIGLRVAFEIR